jgi:hypothetical protein
MAETNPNASIRIEVLNQQRQFLGGTVDIELTPQEPGQTVSMKGADASQAIEVSGLQRAPHGGYHLTVTAAGAAKPATQLVSVPATGSGTVQVVLEKAVGPVVTAAAYVVQGNLVFDTGLPAGGITVRVYSVVFGGKDVMLSQVNADATGKYVAQYQPPSPSPNIQIRVVGVPSAAGAPGNEVTISATKYNAQASETLNLVVPSSLQPLAPEFQRLAADMQTSIGGVANLSQAQEGAARQDLTLLNRWTKWDTRLVALGALAAQQTTATGLGQDVLYSLYRIGMPTDPSLLAMVPVSAVQQALQMANDAGIVSMNADQIASATKSFQNFAGKAQLALTSPGMVSKFSDLLNAVQMEPAQQTAFANLYFSNPRGPQFWTEAATLKFPTETLEALKLQGKLLHLTFNNATLAKSLQQNIGTLTNLSQLADKDYHLSNTWQTLLTKLAGTGGDQTLQSLIPSAYAGKSTADQLAAYAGDMARKVRTSFPTQTVARMIERNDLPLSENTAANVTAFLRAAAPLGYSLGRTPLNAFLKSSAGRLPALDAESTDSLKTLHRLYQITPSSESLQAAVKMGFTSARDIAAYSKDEFIDDYASEFPAGEAQLIYGQAQTVSSVTFNLFAMAKQLDNSPPIYGMSGSDDDRQNAKNAIVEQFPSMASLFGNMDFCQCEDCRSVLSPAAYFVDVLEFLNHSSTNSKGYTPLDVLIGSTDSVIAGRRPDLGALPLTCDNTNTAMPYIDIVNEILEYYIANSHLDTNYAYDTGSATTAELTAEPQHILPQVYNTTLKDAVYPLSLPFDLWIETVRGFLNYFNSPLAQVLDTLRPVDNLALFTDANSYPYYRAQILAEALGLSPSDYEVIAGTDATVSPLVTNWFKLYGYPDEATALNGKPDPTDPTQYLIPPLKNAENLAQLLGLTYQQLTDLVTTGFLNPKLYPLIYQFNRFGIDMSTAFSYTSQPGYPALTASQTAAFEAQLAVITNQYKAQNSSSTFDAKAWLKSVLPANYSQTVLVLADPDSGCDFGATTLQYADNATAAKPLDFVMFNLFVRLWNKLGWTMHEVSRALQLFFPMPLPAWTDAGFGPAFTSAWKTALVYLAHLDDLNTKLAPAMGRVALLPFWTNLQVQGKDPLYAQLFLTPSVLNNDWAFDDPRGNFPTPLSDLTAAQQAFSAHLPAVQGVLGLTSDEITAIFADAGAAVTSVTQVVNGQNVQVPSFTLTNLSICYAYSTLAKCLQMDVTDMISLRVMSGLNPFQALSGSPLSVLADDVLYNQTLLFVKEVQVVQNSGFTVEDLQYLLRQQFDPVGKYQPDINALLSLAQSIAGGLQQIETQDAVPPNLASQPESLIDQTLSGLLPAPILKSLFTLLTNAQTFTASQTGVAAAIDPSPFAGEPELSFSYDSTTETQSVSFQGLLLDWKKAQLETINTTPLFSSLMDGLQQQAQTALAARAGDLLGVWASMAEYEAVQTGAATGLPVAPLTQADPALSLSYDQTDKLQWMGYRGVLTDAKKNVLTAVAIPAGLAPLLLTLLNDIQQQAMPAYSQMVGSFVAMLTNVQMFTATQSAVTTANQIDPNAFATALATAQQNSTIIDPVPPIQFSYDPVAQIQTLTCEGVLTASMQTQLAALIPASAVLANLLAAVRTQALNLFQTLATNLLTVTATALDTYSQPFIGLDVTTQQKQVKADLVTVFLPLLTQKLSRQLILQTLSSNLASDPSLTEALVTDAALLTDPSNPGKSLLGAFLALGQQGVSACYFTSTDGSGTPQATGTAATTDTADPTNSKPGTASAHFEGYLQVATDGPYRFFAELGDTGAAALFQLDAPDPAALLNNPIIPSTSVATTDNYEVSQFVDLVGGALYHFTLDFTNLGANGASLLIQGETFPKGPLSQVTLYPEQTVTGFMRADTLLAKALQILETTGIDEREISYLIANSSEFNNLKLSSLPTEPSDDTLANATALFSQFLTLADYADLRKGPAGGTDGLIDVFQNVGVAYTEPAGSQSASTIVTTPWTAFANLTRRDAATVRAVGEYFGLISDTPVGANNQVEAVGDFGNNKGIRRIWQALQLVQIVGIPVASLTPSTVIASLSPPAGAPTPDVIAANFKNAVKAQYTVANWLPIAQSVFDKLRQEKRDALVAYLVNALQLENSNQLFEYFLVDPGMEPVVQTSRLRLAMSSLQTFIQRCLLNLENGNTSNANINVSASAIDAETWEWMKRYRVWEANREIFLFPENWLVPELRLDATDLFQTLESALLQGDVTDDLVSDAFYDYLKGLDQRARLDIVSMYLDQNLTTAGLSTLYVLGRTYGHPHKYFYRTYAEGVWTGWVAVTPDIESDHVALAIWKGRLNIFWVTFITQAQAPSPSAGTSGSTAVSQLSFGALANDVSAGVPQIQVQVQLHWIEYFQGKWSDRISSELNTSAMITGIYGTFDADSDVYIHVTKEVDESGNEGAIRIHLDLYNAAMNGIAFRVTSKNCSPDCSSSYWQPAQFYPYGLYDYDATRYTGSNAFGATVETEVVSTGSETWAPEPILNTVNNYEFLPCCNPVLPPFVDPTAASFYQDTGALVAPFFFKDASNRNANSSGYSPELTFFVQPSLTETTIDQWEWWAIAPSTPVYNWSDSAAVSHINVVAQVPTVGPARVPLGDPVYSLYPVKDTTDWVTSPGVAVAYGSTLIGKTGGVSVGESSIVGPAGMLSGGQSVTSGMARGGVVSGLTIVGKQGLTSKQIRSTNAAQSASLGMNAGNKKRT